MRRYNQPEIDQRVKALYNRLISTDSLINAKRIAKGVHDMCRAEVKRRKKLESK